MELVFVLLLLAQPKCGEGVRWVTSQQLADRIIERTSVPIPPLAKQGRFNAFVRILVVTDASGSIHCLRLVSGHPILVATTMDSVQRWKFDAAFPKACNQPIQGILILYAHTDNGWGVELRGSTRPLIKSSNPRAAAR